MARTSERNVKKLKELAKINVGKAMTMHTSWLSRVHKPDIVYIGDNVEDQQR